MLLVETISLDKQFQISITRYAKLYFRTLRLHSGLYNLKQESSAKLTNQRVSYAFTSSPLSFHARHILPTSKFQHSYSCILLIFCISEQNV